MSNAELVMPAKLTSLEVLQKNPIALFVIDEPGKFKMNEPFKKLGAIRNEIGWWIKPEHKGQVEELCKQADMAFTESNIPAKDWETLKRHNTITWLENKKEDCAKMIKEEASKYGIAFDHEASNESLKNIEYQLDGSAKYQNLKKLVTECRGLNNSIIYKRNEEKVANVSAPSPIILKFIYELPINYLTTDAPETPTLVSIMDGSNTKPFIRKGIVGAIVGAGGIGKTHLLVQLALSVATGKCLFEKLSTGKAGYVFIGLGENSDEDIHRIFRKHSYAGFTKDEIATAVKHIVVKSFMGEDASFVKKGGEATDYYKNLIQALIEKEPEGGWSLIILDPISRCLGPDAENDNAAATRFISLLENMILRLKGNPTILFGHHMSKSGFGNSNTDQTASRGSSAITDGVRWQANLERVEDSTNQVKLKIVKSNHTQIYEPMILEKDNNGCLRSVGAGKTIVMKASDLK